MERDKKEARKGIGNLSKLWNIYTTDHEVDSREY